MFVVYNLYKNFFSRVLFAKIKSLVFVLEVNLQ